MNREIKKQLFVAFFTPAFVLMLSAITFADGNPHMQVELTDPAITKNVATNNTFLVNATIMCMEGFCGNVSAVIRYNQSDPLPDTNISTTQGDIPFYVTDNPNPQNCSANPIVEGEYCELNWIVNATGPAGTIHEIGALFQSNMTDVPDNYTSNHTVNIVACIVDMTIQWSNISFGNVFPGDSGISAQGNDDMEYNVTIETATTCNVDLYMKGTDMEHDASSYSIPVENMTWNNASNDYSSSYNLTTDWQLLNFTVAPGENATMYFWLNAPWGIEYGSYSGNLTVKAAEGGQSP